MIQCQNCGRVNNYGSNFCRFCGTKFLVNQVSSKDNFDQSPQRQPYSWKTDEFQVAEAPARSKQKPFAQVQPQPFQYPANVQQQQQRSPLAAPNFQPPLAYQNPQQSVAHGFNCPRCAGQFVRYERKISNAGWIVFAVLLVTLFPLFWIGFLIKEDVQVCQTCGFRLS